MTVIQLRHKNTIKHEVTILWQNSTIYRVDINVDKAEITISFTVSYYKITCSSLQT